MDIFTNRPIDPCQIDYGHWQTLNGDYSNIHTAREEYLTTLIQVLEVYMERYPAHSNYPVWANYLNSLEDELDQRYCSPISHSAAARSCPEGFLSYGQVRRTFL